MRRELPLFQAKSLATDDRIDHLLVNDPISGWSGFGRRSCSNRLRACKASVCASPRRGSKSLDRLDLDPRRPWIGDVGSQSLDRRVGRFRHPRH